MSSCYSYRSVSNQARYDLLTRVTTVPEVIVPKTMDFSNFRDTGELSDIVVVVEGTEYKLHKFPLYIKSDFFRALARSNLGEKDRIELADFPGGVETFELVANYCYNIKIDIKRDNVCRLRCAAEFLQMTSGGNLAAVTDRFLQDTLTSAKLGRSLATILDLMLQCCDLGPIAEQAKIVEKCVNAIVDCWLISAKFSRRLEKDSVSGEAENFQKFCKLPLNWFMLLFTTARDKNVRPAVLANMVEMYVTDAMERETKTQTKSSTASTADKPKAENETDGDQSDGTPVDDEADADKDKKDEEEDEEKEDGKEPGSKGSEEDKPEADLASILDALLPELPDNAPLAETISPQWAAKMLCTAESLGEKSRERLVKLAGKVLHRFTSEELQEMSPNLLCEVVKETNKDPEEGGHPELVAIVVDNYLLQLAEEDQLTVETFQKMVEVIPKEHRVKHDILFEALEKLLNSETVEVTEDEKQALLELIDFTKLSESTLLRAYESKLVPGSYITKAALDLCGKLRSELDTAKAILRAQEVELEKYGLGGRGTAFLRRYDEAAGRDHSSTFNRTSASRPKGDMELHIAMDSFDRSLDRSLAREPSSPLEVVDYPSYYSRSYYPDDRDSGIDGSDSFRGGCRLGMGAYYPYSNKVYTS